MALRPGSSNQPEFLCLRMTCIQRMYTRNSYSVLLPVGLALPLSSLIKRCALTAPFHPYRNIFRRFVFCGAFPQDLNPGRTLFGTVSVWSPDFPQRQMSLRLPSRLAILCAPIINGLSTTKHNQTAITVFAHSIAALVIGLNPCPNADGQNRR